MDLKVTAETSAQRREGNYTKSIDLRDRVGAGAQPA